MENAESKSLIGNEYHRGILVGIGIGFVLSFAIFSFLVSEIKDSHQKQIDTIERYTDVKE